MVEKNQTLTDTDSEVVNCCLKCINEGRLSALEASEDDIDPEGKNIRMFCPYHGWMTFPPNYSVRESVVKDALILARTHLGDHDELGVIATRVWNHFRGTNAFLEVDE